MGESNTIVSAYTLYKHLQYLVLLSPIVMLSPIDIMGESNTIVSAYKLYRHLQ